MEIDWPTTARVVATLVPAVVAVVAFASGPGGLRSRLRHDAEVLEKLPPGSAAHTELLDLVATQVTRIAQLETDASRNWPMLVGAALATPFAFWGTIELATADHWWWWIVAVGLGFTGLALLYGIFESAQRVPRDKDGNRL